MAKKSKIKKPVLSVSEGTTTEVFTRKEAIAEARRSLDNAKEILNEKTSILNDRYSDQKYVRQASGMAYLAATIPIRSFLFEQGIVKDKRKLPKTIDQYTMFIKKLVLSDSEGTRNGKLMDYYNTVYENLHVAGYYEGYCNVGMIKSGFENVKKIIDTLDQ